MCACVYFSSAYSVFRFMIAAGWPLSGRVLLTQWDCATRDTINNNHVRSTAGVGTRLLRSVSCSSRTQTFIAPTLTNSTPLICAVGRSAGCSHAVFGRAPGPKAASAGQREGERGAVSSTFPDARQTGSPTPHGGRWDSSHRAGLASISTHR